MENEQLYDFVAQRTARCKILVVGDVMLDKYYYGEVTRISPEAPVPITHVLETKETLGGAANVAHNLALLGCETSIAGFVGEQPVPELRVIAVRVEQRVRAVGLHHLVGGDGVRQPPVVGAFAPDRGHGVG